MSAEGTLTTTGYIEHHLTNLVFVQIVRRSMVSVKVFGHFTWILCWFPGFLDWLFLV
jgi:hypothetical protein